MLFNILPWRKKLSFAKRKTNLFKKVLNKNRLNVCRFKKKLYLCNAFEEIQSSKHFGEMAEWSIAAVLKTVVLRGTGGSNPSLSAKKQWLLLFFMLIICWRGARVVEEARLESV